MLFSRLKKVGVLNSVLENQEESAKGNIWKVEEIRIEKALFKREVESQSSNFELQSKSPEAVEVSPNGRQMDREKESSFLLIFQTSDARSRTKLQCFENLQFKLIPRN